MTPERLIEIVRTQNDTDRIAMILRIQDDAGTTVVADSDTVTLRVGTDPVTSVVGTAKGDSSGTFYFVTTAFTATAGELSFNVEVNDGTYTYTVASGTIKQLADVV